MSKLEQVAKLAGVSKATVSRVINNGASISDNTRSKVNEALIALNLDAQQLKRNNQETRMIGFILPLRMRNAYNNFGIDIALGAEDKAFDNDYMPLVGDSSTSKLKEESLVAAMLNRDVEGLIILSRWDSITDHLSMLKNSGVPFVLVDQKVNDFPAHYCIEIDNPEPDTYNAMCQLLSTKPRPSAVFFSSPLSIEGCIRAVNEFKLRIPEDLSVVVFDDTYADLPKDYQDFFTAVNQSGKLVGSMAMEILFHQIKNPQAAPQEIIIPGTLNIRKSVARVSPT